ncbi:unnamed protein product [Microthlaspi erraticum]|uniref:Uncharacterized protein n=1 Tax=Microthlaspi erraticum TaxID=1685480 RepID=A0A6D2KEF7_9BRAS|nr:unnamed protein product [Microthlaspi erraticum]
MQGFGRNFCREVSVHSLNESAEMDSIACQVFDEMTLVRIRGIKKRKKKRWKASLEIHERFEKHSLSAEKEKTSHSCGEMGLALVEIREMSTRIYTTAKCSIDGCCGVLQRRKKEPTGSMTERVSSTTDTLINWWFMQSRLWYTRQF